MSSLCFFYGSLKQGFHNYNRFKLNTQQLLGPATTKEKLALVSFWAYPALFRPSDGPAFNIKGELYVVDDSILMPIRNMELGAGYREELIDVICHEKEHQAKAYLYPEAQVAWGKRIQGDEWRGAFR